MRRCAGRIRAALLGGIASTAAILGAGVSLAAAQGPVYPDLVSDPPTKAGVETYTSEGRTRLLLRFEAYVHNAGQGALEIRGSRPDNSQMGAVEQRIYSTPTAYTDRSSSARVVYERADGHDHWHLQKAARYSLWNASKTAEVAPAMKVGFCLEDSEHVDAHGPRDYAYSADAGFCEQYKPSAPSVVMGVSAGWRDVYSRRLAFQWVDVSDVQPGAYWLRSEVDPDDVIFESSESNAASFAARSSIVPGYVAEPVSAGTVPHGQSVAIPLRATQHGSPSARQFRIESAPRCGDLDKPVGQWFSESSVVYTARLGCSGPDGFDFSARDSTSEFPLNPASASASLTVGSPPLAETVAISGAPSQVYTGTSAQLTATVTNGPQTVTWSVSGVGGGNPTVGTISSTGLYRAPAAVPPGGNVAIRATSGTGAFDEATVRVVDAPQPKPAIIPPPASSPFPQTRPPAKSPSPEARRSALSRLRVSRRGRLVYVRVVSRRSGWIRMSVRRGRTRVARCRSTLVSARRPYTCRMRVRSGVSTRRLRVRVTLRARGRIVASRTARVPAPRSSRHHH